VMPPLPANSSVMIKNPSTIKTIIIDEEI